MRRVLVVALGLLLAGSLFAEPVTLLETTSTSSALRFIDSALPSVSLGFAPITGVQPGEFIAAIDYRPADGLLYGIGALGGTTARLYRINTTTGVVTQIGAPFALNAANVIGMDFNPVVDRIRVISNVGTNLRIDPTTGTVFTDTNVDYAAGDPNAGSGNTPWGLAYTNNFVGAPSTTLYGVTLGFSSMILVTVGSVNGIPLSPNSGQMFTVGSTGINSVNNQLVGLDISAGGTAYGLLNNAPRFYTVNLATGAATLIGDFPVTTFGQYRDLAVGGAVFASTPGIPALSPLMLLMLAMTIGAVALLVMRR